MPARKKKARRKEIRDYDKLDTTTMIDRERVLRLEDLGLELPATPTTQVISIRLPSPLLNEIRAYASQRDIPYQAAIKLFLSEAVRRRRRKAA
jgi:predicted DNA binding CopG/RHH family protein